MQEDYDENKDYGFGMEHAVMYAAAILGFAFGAAVLYGLYTVFF